jgi:hypothetical protein
MGHCDRNFHTVSEVLRSPIDLRNCLYCWLGGSFRSPFLQQIFYLIYSESMLFYQMLSVFRRRISALIISHYWRLSSSDQALITFWYFPLFLFRLIHSVCCDSKYRGWLRHIESWREEIIKQKNECRQGRCVTA